jgi:hypothetical protein
MTGDRAAPSVVPLDVDAVYAEHEVSEHDDTCRACGETYPCGALWAADRISTLRARPRSSPE